MSLGFVTVSYMALGRQEPALRNYLQKVEHITAGRGRSHPSNLFEVEAGGMFVVLRTSRALDILGGTNIAVFGEIKTTLFLVGIRST